ncbi:alcohol dehydrogenase, partial [Vibrio parahaemolyticus]
ISTHYMPEQIHQHFGDGSNLGVNISYVHEDSPLGTGGALGLLPEDMPRDLPLIMINGDVLTKVDFQRLLNFHIENDAD